MHAFLDWFVELAKELHEQLYAKGAVSFYATPSRLPPMR
jgi:hypothetical protein